MEVSSALLTLISCYPLIIRGSDLCDSFGPSDIDGASSLLNCAMKAERLGRGSIIYFNKSNLTCRTWSQCRYATGDGGCRSARFFRIEKGQEVTLLQTRAQSKVNPYDILMQTSTNSSFYEAAQLTSIYPYKSPLLAMQTRVPLEQVRLELFDASDSRVAYLTFSFRSGGRLEDASAWFAKDRLVSSSPWNINTLKSSSYNVFDLYYKDSYVIREFHINKNFGGCPSDVGVLSISVKGVCTWEQKSPSPVYVWSHHNGAAAKYDTNGKEAFKLALVGKIGTVDSRWFIREYRP